ncbi:hypothetical protein BH10PSE12_BH10PSE12_04940 [soil metagenome]
MTRKAALFAICSLAMASAAPAQMPSLGSLGGGSGAGGLLGGVLPNVGSIGAGNAAGVLGYCVKNKFLGAGSAGAASSVLGRLTGQKGVKSSKGYAAGQGGLLQMEGGSALSLASVKGKVKSKVCDMVLKHAQSLI